jgi:O-antigen ligase
MNNTRHHILFYLMLIMLGSLFLSRSILAISMMAFVVVALIHRDAREQLASFIDTPLLWGMSLLFFIPLLSGLWSTDQQHWTEVVKTKLPLLFLPLAFATRFRFSTSQWGSLAVFFIAVVFIASGWTLIQYAGSPGVINDSYLKAKTMITPLANDHVRFSWLVFAAILTSSFLFYQERKRSFSWILVFVAILLTIYLHVLAARTGLLSFYLSLFILALWALSKTKLKMGLIILASIILLPVAAYFIFPSFRNKLLYFKYEWAYLSKTHYLPHSNDAVRVISMKAGLSVMTRHPLAGVGYGDAGAATEDYYDNQYPQMEEADKILPSSQWILFGMATGITGGLLFLFCLLLPFFTSVTYPLPWWMLNGTLAIEFFYDIPFEVQFGVFIYSFFILWWWQWMKAQKV